MSGGYKKHFPNIVILKFGEAKFRKYNMYSGSSSIYSIIHMALHLLVSKSPMHSLIKHLKHFGKAHSLLLFLPSHVFAPHPLHVRLLLILTTSLSEIVEGT